MKRRFLAMLLSLLMVFAMLPVSAFAADDFDEDSVESLDLELMESEEGNAENGIAILANFYADGEVAKTAMSKDDCERNTMWTRVSGLTSADKTYTLEIVAPDGKTFKGEGETATQKLTLLDELKYAENNKIPGCYFTLKGWSTTTNTAEAITGGELDGTYTINLYENPTEESGQKTLVTTTTIELTKVTVDFNTTGAEVAKLITQGEGKGTGNNPQYFFDFGDDKTKATFYADVTDLEAEESETAYEVLTSLLTIAKSGEGDDATEQYTDGNGKKWVYDDTTTPTFTYADVVTIKTSDTENVTPPTATVLKKADETFEVSVTPNYLPAADGVTFTLKTAGSTGATTTNATWTGKLTDLTKITTAEVSVSATAAVSVKAAADGIDFPSANVVTEQNAATKIAMFAITPADTEANKKATAIITVTSEKQPEVTSPANYGIFVVDNAEDKTWKLTKEDAKAEEITVGLKDDIKSIDDLTATATREAKQGGGATIKLAVDDEDVTSFKYKASTTEAEKPEPGAKAGEAYTLYNEAGFDYVDENDYVEVVTVNDYDEIIAWGLAVIPSAEAKVETEVTVDDTTGKAEADVTTNEVDTALEKALQDEETEVTLDFNTSDSDSTKEIKSVEVGIPVESLDKIADHNKTAEEPVSVAVNTPAGDVTANKAVLDAIAETDTKLTDTEADKVASTKVVLSIQKTVEEGDATTAKSEAFEIKFEKVVTFSDETPDKRVEVKVEASVPVSVPTALTPTSGKLFTYFKNTANKLFYIAMANVTGGRASFVAPHLSTYVLYEKEDPTGGIGVNLITKNVDGSEDQDPIRFDENREYTINLEEGKTSVTIGIPSTEVKVGTTTNGSYDPDSGVFALGEGKTSATMTFTKGTGEDAITYTLILKKADSTEEDDSNAPTDITIGGSAAGENVNFEPDPTDPTKKTATVEVSSEGTAISFKVASGATVTWTKADGSTGDVTRNPDGTLSATVNPGDRIEIVNSDGTTYIMDFTADGTPSTGGFRIKADDVGLGDTATLSKVFKGVTIENTTSGKVYVVEVIDSEYASGTANNLLIMDGNGSDVRFYLLNSVTKIKVWEVDENDVLTASGNINALLLGSPATEETF